MPERIAGQIRLSLQAWQDGKFDKDHINTSQKVNGVLVNQTTGYEAVPGEILFTAEGQEIHFGNLRVIPK